MTIPVMNILQIHFPTATFGVGGNVVLEDHGDNNGVVISSWNVPNQTQPTTAQLIFWQNDAATIQAYNFQQNAITNASIIAQLTAIDMKSIRSLRENDTQMLSQFVSQAAALRAQLLPTSAPKSN